MAKAKKEELDLRIFYLCVHKRLCDKVDRTRIMNKKDFYDILGRTYHLPKKLWPCVLKEMEQMNMIKNLGCRKNNNIEVLPMITDPEENANQFYQDLGIF